MSDMNQLISVLGNAVHTARENRHLSQEALAERIGVCKRTIIDIENNTGNPKFEISYMLVRELNLQLYQIFYPKATENLEVRNIDFKWSKELFGLWDVGHIICVEKFAVYVAGEDEVFKG